MEGCRMMREILRVNTNMTTLQLWCDEINKEGNYFFWRQIFLALTGNEIGNEGARMISDGLQNNSTLKTLDLWSDKAFLNWKINKGAQIYDEQIIELEQKEWKR